MAAATAASAGSRVLVTANSVGVRCRRLASDRLKAIAVAPTATTAIRATMVSGSPAGCAVHGGNRASSGTLPMHRPHAVAEPGSVSFASRAEPSM